MVLIFPPFVLTGASLVWVTRDTRAGRGGRFCGSRPEGCRTARLWIACHCQAGPASFSPPPKAAVVVARRTQLWLDEEAPPPSLACLMLMRFVIAASCSFQTRGLTNISAPAVSLLDLDRNTAHMHEPALVLNFSTGENI